MIYSRYFVFILLSLISFIPAVAADGYGSHQSVGLVLSGGGAKGIAHIGALQALEENYIPIDYITGTSMGAIVGGLYACGYTPAEMLDLITSNYFSYLSTGRIDPEFTYYFSQEKPSPQMFSFSLGSRDSTSRERYNPQSLISPTPMVFGFMEIFGAYTAQCRGDFDRLFVPFRCVASNMTQRRKHVFASGSVADAIRASMSFPLVFQAVKIGGDVYYDGGIFDNFPVDVMRSEFAPSVMLGFDVSASSKGPQNSYMDQLDMLVTQPQSYDLPESDGVKVRINLSDFGLLDFGAAREIYKRGYDRTMEMMDSIKARVHTRVPSGSRELRRAVFKSQTPALRFSEVKVTGGTPRQNEYLEYLFHPAQGADTIGVDRARLAFYRAISSDKLSGFVPTATAVNDSSGLFRLNLRATVKSKFDLGVGAYITSSNNSFLYLRAGYSTMSFSSLTADLSAWIGQSYMAGMLSGSAYLHSSIPSALKYHIVASRKRYYESEKLFFRDNEPSFVVNHDYFGRLAWSVATGRTGALDVGIGGGREYNTFYRNSSPESYKAGRDHIALDLGQVFVSYSSSTLDNGNYPTSGHYRSGRAMALAGNAKYYNAVADNTTSDKKWWLRLDWRERDYLDLGKHFSLGLEGQAVLSTRQLLESYYAAISTAPSYNPTPASNNIFDPKMRADSFLALAAVPVYKYNSSLSGRLSLNLFAPLRAIKEGADGNAMHDRWFRKVYFFGEADVVYSLPFADICVYCNYAGTSTRFSAGISLGFYLEAPKFL